MRSARSRVDSEDSRDSLESGADRDGEVWKCKAVRGNVVVDREEIGRIAVVKNAGTDLVR